MNPAAVLGVLVQADVGGASAKLSQFNRQYNQVENSTRRGIKAQLSGNFDQRGFNTYSRAVGDASKKSVKKAELGANVQTGGFNNYSNALGTARKNTDTHVGGMKQSFGGLTGAIKGMAGALGALGVAFVAYQVAKDAIKTTVDLYASTVKVTAATGMDMKTASRWIEVMKIRGVESNALTMGFVTLERNMRNAAGGSSTAMKAFQQLGVPMKDIKSQNLQAVILDIADAYQKSNNPVQRAAIAQQLFGRNAKTLMPVLAQGRQGIEQMLGAAGKLGAEIGPNQSQKFKEARLATFGFKLALDGLKITFTTAILPILTRVMMGLTWFIAKVREGTGIGAPMHYMYLGVAWAANLAGKAISWLAKQFEAGKPGATGFASVLQWLVNAAKNVANAMVTAAQWIGTAWGDLSKWFSANLMPVFRGIASVLGPVFSTLFSALSTIISGFVSVVSALFTNILMPVFRALATVFSTYVYPVMSAAFTAIKWLAVNVLLPVLQGLAWVAQNILLPVFTFVFNAIKTVVLAAVTVIGWLLNNVLIPAIQAPAWVLNNVIVPAFTFVFNIVKTVVTGVVSAIGAIVSGIAAAASAVWGAVSAIFNTILGVIRGAWGAVWSAAVFVFNAIGSALSTAWTAIWTSLTWVWNTVTGVIRSVWSAVWSAAMFVWTAISSALSAAWSAIWTSITWVWNQITGIVRGAWSGIWSAATFVFGAIGSAASAAWSAISGAVHWIIDHVVGIVKGAWSTLWNAGRSLFEAVVSGLKSALQTVINTVTGFLNKIFDATLNHIPGVKLHISPVKLAQGGQVPMQAQKGMMVKRPMAIVGEEAPRHPEYVIPTNPAYRSRAVGLLSQAAGAMGLPQFATGGTFGATAYGPPWGGIEGGGTTATGIDLSRGQPAYIVAVDPSVIPLHSQLTATPNPFGYTGTFAAEDTGGAIKGNRIDFYDWMGRAHQNNWGMRNVTVQLQAGRTIGQIVGGTAAAGLDFSNLLGALPKASESGFGDWFKGLAPWILSKVKSIILAPLKFFPNLIKLIGNIGGAAGPSPMSGKPAIDNMIAAANWITAQHYGYVWGGGHNSSFSGPYDCSGAVSAVLHSAGLLGSPLVSGDLANWGDSGPGQWVTIFANAGHAFMSIMNRFFGTSGSNPGGGAAWYGGSALPGFAQRHPPGLARGGTLQDAIPGISTIPGAVRARAIRDLSFSPNSILPGLATGGKVNGLAIVGEGGPELVSLPAGSQVYSNSTSRSMIGQAAAMGIPGYQGGTGGGGTNVIGTAGSPYNWGAGGGSNIWGGFTTPAYTSALDQMLGMPALPQTPAGWGLRDRGSKGAQKFVDQALSTIAGFSTRIEMLDHQSSTLQSYFTAIQQDLVDPTTGEINQGALQSRLQQMDQLIRISQEIFDLWSQIVAWYYQVLEIYDEILIWNAQFNLNWWNKNPKAGGKNRKTNIDNAKTALSNYQSARADVAGKLGEGAGSRQEAWIKIIQATADRADVAATKPNVQASQTGTTAGTDQQTQQLLDLANQQAQTLSQRLAVSQAQYATIAGFTMPGLATGGIIGKAGWAMVGEQGPEPVYLGTGATVYSNQTPPVTTNVRVVVEDNRTPRVFVDDVEQAVETVTRRTARNARRNLPGSGGY